MKIDRKFRESVLPKCLCLLLFLLLLINPQFSTAENQLSSIINRIKETYSHLPGFSVPYRREIQSRSMAMLGESDKSDLASGKMFFKPPYSCSSNDVLTLAFSLSPLALRTSLELPLCSQWDTNIFLFQEAFKICVYAISDGPGLGQHPISAFRTIH